MRCKKCDKPVKPSADRCPHCGQAKMATPYGSIGHPLTKSSPDSAENVAFSDANHLPGWLAKVLSVPLIFFAIVSLPAGAITAWLFAVAGLCLLVRRARSMIWPKKFQGQKGLIPLVGSVILLIGGAFIAYTSSVATSKAKEEARIAAEVTAKSVRLKSELEANLHNADWLADNYSSSATAACAMQVVKYAKGNYEWVTGFGERKFPLVYAETKGPGIFVIGGDKVRFQNAFGAWQVMSYQCAYDALNDRVVGVNIGPR